ncbi:MAG: glycosyltransferase [Halofilum sp. (in: g-proteobacteria)]|nr:glycosyltransferase [Halofilum sp. (in: g-proteobacteria)]
MVEAAARLLPRGPGSPGARLRLVLVGDGAQGTAVREAVTAAGLDDNTWLPGSRDDVPALLAALDVFALPSLAEGISNTILEALAAGVAVVATDVGGNRELVTPGQCGALVPPGDPAALAAALARYLHRPGLAAEHGTVARRRAVGQFSIDAMVSAYTETYDRVLERHGRAEPRARGLPTETG